MSGTTHSGVAGGFDRATEMLSDEHRVIERGLNIIEKLTQLPVDRTLESWKQVLDFARHFADQCHHLKEEKILFPAMEAHGISNEGGPIGVMLMEHEEGRSHVRSMFAAVELIEAKDQAARESLVANARAYVRLLREHIQKEDEILFRIADDVIPADEQRQLLRTFEEHETNELGAGVHERYLRLVQMLEARID
jgi:hemerythrin-like domain-containing protein